MTPRKPLLSLDSLTLTDTSPLELIRSAAAAGFDLVSLWTIAPPLYPRQLLDPASERDCAHLLRDSGVCVHSLEAIDLTDTDAIRAARPAMELGARLGAEVVLALNYANPDQMQAAEMLALLSEQAAECGLGVNLEPVAMGQTRTLAEAASLIAASGRDVGVVFDTYHFARIGGSLSDLIDFPPELIRYVQVCDGLTGVPPEAWEGEAVQERLYPSMGDFPLADMLRLLPANVPWAIETPSLARAMAGVSPLQQAIEARDALSTLLQTL